MVSGQKKITMPLTNSVSTNNYICNVRVLETEDTMKIQAE